MEAEQIIIAPITTEKTVRARELTRYTFKINLLATKIAVKQAVEKLFKVKVKAVNLCYVRPKIRMSGRGQGRTSRWKKAYVTLVAGQKIQELEV